MAVLVGRAVQFKEPVLLIGETGCAALGGCISRPCVPRPPCAMLACTIMKNVRVTLNLHVRSNNCSASKTFGLRRSLSVKKNSFVNMV